MDRADLLDGFPVPPPERPLPDHVRRREDLLAAVRATGRGDRRPARHRRLVPLAAAAAVLAIVVPLSVAGSNLLPSSSGGGPQSGRTGGTQPSESGLTYSRGLVSFTGGERHRTDTLTATSQLQSLSVRTDTGSITVTGTSDSTASVTERLAYGGSAPGLDDNLTGNHLSLGYACGQGGCVVSYVIRVPRGVAVSLHTGTGAIKVSGLSGQVVASTDTGPVTGTDLSSASADLSSRVGSVTVAFSAAPRTVRAVTDTGPITVQLPAGGTYNVSASSDVGAVRVSVPQDQSSPYAITARSDVGSVTITGG